jgi:hypothetical protein
MPSLRPIAILFLAAVTGYAMPAPAAVPVLVELYQSQGCSSCPPAEANLNAIADKPGVIALSFGVTYWDQLGWKDTFATPQFTQRQWDYSRFNQRGNVATPQVWVNGRTTIVGNNGAEFAAAIAKATSSGPAISVAAGKVEVAAGSAPKGGADLWVARYDPRTIEVPIRAGENGGKTLPHKNIVRELVKIGHWSGGAQSFALPASRRPGLATAAFLQAGTGGPVLSAAKA